MTSAKMCQCQCGRPYCASIRNPRQWTHGLKSTYTVGCRCELCTCAHTKATEAQRKRVNDRTRDRAEHYKQEWTGPELEIATRSDLTAAQAARMLGRTMHGVKRVRAKCRTEPRYMKLLGAVVG